MILNQISIVYVNHRGIFLSHFFLLIWFPVDEFENKKNIGFLEQPEGLFLSLNK